MNDSIHRHSTAFTLLEMLVVLVIVSMITLLLMQSLQYVFDLRLRFVQQLDDLQQGALKTYWFRSSTAALLPDYARAPNVVQNRPERLFKGQATRFSGLTLAGLEAEPGVPTGFAWELKRDGDKIQLEYHTENEQVWPILSWSGRQGAFQYLDQTGQWHAFWPPMLITQEKTPQLPEAIAFNGTKRGQPFTWIVRVTGNKDDPDDYRLMFDPNNPL